MEDSKKVKEVKLKAEKKVSEPKKLTYDQLNDACNQLFQQNRKLVERNQNLEQYIMNKRLDYIFKVVENATKFSESFVDSCSKEIEDALTYKKEQEAEG